MSKYIFFILVLFGLSSCSKVILNDFVYVNKDLTFDKAKTIYNEKHDFNEVLIEKEIDGSNFKMIYLSIETDAEMKSRPTMSVGGMGRGSKELEKGTTDFHIIFKNDNYFYSGFEYQFILTKNDNLMKIFTELRKMKKVDI